MLQLAEAEAELDAMTKDRDELQAVVDELEEKVIYLVDRIVIFTIVVHVGTRLFGVGITIAGFTHTFCTDF